MSYQPSSSCAGYAPRRLLDDADVARRFDKRSRRRAGVSRRSKAGDDDIVGPIGRRRTHQTLRPYFFLRCKPKAAMKHELTSRTSSPPGCAAA